MSGMPLQRPTETEQLLILLSTVASWMGGSPVQNWIDFNGILIHLRLFYIHRLWNCRHCIFLFTWFNTVIWYQIFLSNTNISTSSYWLNSTTTILSHRGICHLITNEDWYTIKQRNKEPSNSNNLQTDLFDSYMEASLVLQLRFRMNLGVMAMKGYFTFLSYQDLESNHQIQFSMILNTRFLGASYSSAGDSKSRQ